MILVSAALYSNYPAPDTSLYKEGLEGGGGLLEPIKEAFIYYSYSELIDVKSVGRGDSE